MRKSVIHFSVGVLIVTASTGALAQATQANHAPYQTRAPVQCGPFTTFDGSSAAAQRVFQCAEEARAFASDGYIYLVEDLALQVGAARAQTTGEQVTLKNVAEGSRVFPVRGTYTSVQCSVVRDDRPLENRGRSCSEYQYGGQGQCYKTAFGDWTCSLGWGRTKPALHNVAPRNWGQFQPTRTVEPGVQPPVQPTTQTPVQTPAQGGGRRIARDPNRPIAVHDTVSYEDPDNPGVANSCTVQGVYPGAYKVECRDLGYLRKIVRDIDVKRPGGQAPQTSAAGPVIAPFKPNDLVLVTEMGLMDERYWKLCIVVRNAVRASNSYVVDCGNGETNVLPDWVRADPDFQ